MESETRYEKVTMKSSIGFSSLFFGLMWIILISTPFAVFGLFGFLIIAVMMVLLYSFLISVEYQRMLNAIIDNIVAGIYKTKGNLN